MNTENMCGTPVTLKRLRESVSPFVNDLCIFDADIVRMIGVWEDDDDFYYVVRRLRGEVVHWSAVGGFISLRPYIPEDFYNFMDNMFESNGCIKLVE